MNTRKIKRNINYDIVGEEAYEKRDATTDTDKQLKESFQEQSIEIGQAPIFNFHIHVPVNFERNENKLYLPQIQPIIHIHFDELAKELNNNSKSQQDGGLTKKHFQNMVTQSIPKLGNVVLHFENNSFRRPFNRTDLSEFCEKQALQEKNSHIELENNRSNINESVQRQHSETTDRCDSNNCNEKDQGVMSNKLSNTAVRNGHPIKLKRAVVVLEDICKSNFYKNGIMSGLIYSENNRGTRTYSTCRPNQDLDSSPQIKVKCEPTPGGGSANESDKPNAASDDNYVTPLGGTSSSLFDFEFPREQKPGKMKSLTSLIEGCSFSEILQRFRLKHERCAGGHSEKTNIIGESQNVKEDDKGSIRDNVLLIENNVQTQKEALGGEQSHDVEEKNQEEQRETSADGIDVCGNENQARLNFYESDEKYDTETCALSDSASPSVEDTNTTVDPVNESNRTECSVNLFEAADAGSDNNEFTTRNKLSSEVFDDFSITEFESPGNVSGIVKSEFDKVERVDVILVDKEDKYSHFKLSEKEMGPSRKQSTKKEVNLKKKKSRELPGNGPSPKKIKKSPGTPNKSATQARTISSMGDGYIPLNIPGPTEFAVAPLPKVQTSKANSAKNFKKDMLFGKRVNRFSSSDHLRMYKLKMDAARRRSNK